jgi:hypothetical protein
MIFDLDPSGDAPDEVRAAATELGALLRDLGLEATNSSSVRPRGVDGSPST